MPRCYRIREFLFRKVEAGFFQEAVERVALVWLGEPYLMIGTIKTVTPVAEAIRPGNQHGAVRAITHRVDGVGLQDIPVARAEGADPAAHFDDGCPLPGGADLELLPRREFHGVQQIALPAGYAT